MAIDPRVRRSRGGRSRGAMGRGHGALRSRDPFIGRAHELRDLRRALNDAARGRGSVVLLMGERGIGKTRLVKEVATAAQARGAIVSWGVGWERGSSRGYAMWAQLGRDLARRLRGGERAAACASLVPILSGDDEAEQGPAAGPNPRPIDEVALGEALTRLIERQREPVLFVIDDLQWADAGSLRILQVVGRGVSRLPCLILVTCRDEALKTSDALAQIVAGLEQDTRYLRLQPLGPDQVTEFLARRLGASPSGELVSSVEARCAGNPFFLGKLTEHLRRSVINDDLDRFESTLPPGIREEVLGYRLRGLSAACRALVTTAAVIGREGEIVTLEHALEAAGHTSAACRLALRDACATRLLGEDDARGERFAFTYGLVREALLDDLSPVARMEIHLRVAEALERVGPPTELEPTLEIAEHIHRAGRFAPVEKGIRYAIHAAALLERELRFREASQMYERCLELVDRGSGSERERARVRCDILLRLGEAQRRSGDRAQARETFACAVAVAGELAAGDRHSGDADLLARAALGFGADRPWADTGLVDERLLGWLQDALTHLADRDGAWRALVLARISEEFFYSGYNTASWREALSAEAVAIARRIDDSAALASTLRSRHRAAWFTHTLAERIAAAIELVSLARRIRDPELKAHAHLLHALDRLEAGDMVEMGRELRYCAADAAAAGSDLLQWHVNVVKATRAIVEGRLDEGEQLAAAAYTDGAAIQPADAEIFSAVHMYTLHRLRGQFDALLPLAREFADRYPTIAVWRIGVADMCAHLGRLAEARAEFEIFATADFIEPPQDWNQLLGWALLAEVCHALDDRRRAERLYDLLAPYAEHNVTAVPGLACIGVAAYQLGLLATTLEHWDDAALQFERALRRNTAMGALPFVAHTQRQYAAMLIRLLRNGGTVEGRRDVDPDPQAVELPPAGAEVRDILALRGVHRNEAADEGASGAPGRSQPALGDGAPLDPDAGAIRDRAQALLDQAVTLYGRLGMSHFRAVAERMCEELSDCSRGRRTTGRPSTLPDGGNVFRCEGRYWTLCFDGQQAEIEDCLGARYVALLLRQPGVEVSSTDLFAAVQAARTQPRGTTVDDDLALLALGSGESPLDDRARREVRQRLRDIHSELAEAEANNDMGRIDALTFERERLLESIDGSGRLLDDADRIRKKVTKAIRTTLFRRVARCLPALADHFAGSIKTGSSCRYAPQIAIDWEI
ncbi:AAA family ATPase [bacterium]|nr:AAA family ATPase [bacterium]